jgi:hemolysin III
VTPTPPHEATRASAHEEHFSLPLFAVTILATLAVLSAGVWALAPSVWEMQLVAPGWTWLVAFLAVTLVNCFMEYFFHRYILHTSALPWLRRLYRQHTLHHALTRIARRPSGQGQGVLVIENKFPIEEPEQTEASFFPWYSLAVFALILTPLFALLQWLAPGLPWFGGGFLAIAVSLALYEILHAINHWPLEQWLPLLTHPRWGWFWQPLYGFHLRHHAVIDCNESVSGFLGLPLADWLFGTCVIPQTIYADGEEYTPSKFTAPRPRWPISALDHWAHSAMRERRAAAQDENLAATANRAEAFASRLTLALGLAGSVAGLVLLIVFASRQGDANAIVRFASSGSALLVLFAAPLLAQLIRRTRTPKSGSRFDAPAIYFVLTVLYVLQIAPSGSEPWNWILFGGAGLLGAVAALSQALFAPKYRWAAVSAYALAGAAAVGACVAAAVAIPIEALWLLLAGVLCYVAALVFAAFRALPFQVATRNLLLLGGSVCHVLVAVLFLLPGYRA